MTQNLESIAECYWHVYVNVGEPSGFGKGLEKDYGCKSKCDGRKKECARYYSSEH